MRINRHWLGLGPTTLALLLMLTLVGCGRRQTVPMSGAVSLDGQPLNFGTILLTPLDHAAGTTTGASIAEGQYAIVAARGPRRGVAYKVEISAVEPGKAAPGAYPIGKEKVPARYNVESTLEVKIPEDASKFDHDFALTSSGT